MSEEKEAAIAQGGFFYAALFTVFVLKSATPARCFCLAPPKLVLRVYGSSRFPHSLPRHHHPLQPRLRVVAARAVVENRDPKPAPPFAAGRIPLMEVLRYLVRNSGTAGIDPEQINGTPGKAVGCPHSLAEPRKPA